MKAKIISIIMFILFTRIDSKPSLIPGTVDLTFGGNGTGFRLLNMGGTDNAQAMVLDSLGRIVCAGLGGAANDLAVARFTPNGLVDISFGGNGTGFRLLNLGGTDFARAVALDSQGRIVCAGRGGATSDFAIARFTQDGLLDTSFGGNGTGFRLLNLGGTDRAQAMALDSQGRIICVGQGGAANDLAVARFTPDGLLDTTFGGNGTGFRLLDMGGTDRAEALALDSQGRIVCAGRGGVPIGVGTGDLVIARFTPEGLVDTSFGGNGTGFRLLDLGGVNNNAESMALDSQERIVCAGRGGAGGDLAIARFTPEGLVDTSFGGNGTGFRLLDMGGSNDHAEAMVLDTQARIVCSGQGGVGADIALVRFTPNGMLDLSFGGNGTGFRLFSIGGADDRARAMALDSRERIVCSGQGGSINDLAVIRFFGESLSNYAIALREKYRR